MADTIFQHPLVTDFLLPFLLMFFIVFAILEKTKVLGDKKQISALVAFVIGLIFISAFSPKIVVEHIVLFLAVGIVIIFAGMLLFSFGIGGGDKIEFAKGYKWVLGIAIVLGLIIVVLWSTGFGDSLINFFFGNDWSGSFWTNVLFILIIAGALAVALGSKSNK